MHVCVDSCVHVTARISADVLACAHSCLLTCVCFCLRVCLFLPHACFFFCQESLLTVLVAAPLGHQSKRTQTDIAFSMIQQRLSPDLSAYITELRWNYTFLQVDLKVDGQNAAGSS